MLPHCGAQVDGVRNPRVQSIYLEDTPVHRAAFACGGSHILAAGRRPHFYLYDVAASRIERVPGPTGVPGGLKVWMYRSVERALASTTPAPQQASSLPPRMCMPTPRVTRCPSTLPHYMRPHSHTVPPLPRVHVATPPLPPNPLMRVQSLESFAVSSGDCPGSGKSTETSSGSRFLQPSVLPPAHSSVRLAARLPVRLPAWPSTHLSIHPPTRVSVWLSICPSARLSVHPSTDFWTLGWTSNRKRQAMQRRRTTQTGMRCLTQTVLGCHTQTIYWGVSHNEMVSCLTQTALASRTQARRWRRLWILHPHLALQIRNHNPAARN
eukprot:357327-Chlamydomonas_euryale.AAC.1